MHNLRLISVHSVEHNIEVDAAICFNSLNNQFFVADTQGLTAVPRNGCKSEAPSPAHLVTWQSAGVKTEQIISCDLVSVCVCITTREGDVLLYSPDTSEVEVVGTVSDGILASRWSPDEELLVIVTLSHNVTLLNSQFLPVGEFSLNEKTFGEAAFVTVGWGKKETQFHGSAGKEAARAAGNNEGLVSGVAAYDDRRPRIRWRGDGQMFVISFVDENTKARRLRIADRGGVLLCTGENTTFLEASLDWKPNGSLITTSQRLANKYNVIFFEKNGLRHGEFTLPEKDNYFVREVSWNSESSVLMVWLTLREVSDTNVSSDYVQLWTVSNYSWYLKDEIALDHVQKVLWPCDDALSLCIVRSEQILIFQYSQIVDRSISSGSQLALVSVVNGYKLLMTPVKQSKIPPPMCAYEVHFPHQVEAIVFAPKHLCYDDGENLLESALCVLHGCKLSLLVSTESTDCLDSYGCKVDYILGRSPHFKAKFSILKVVKQIDLGDFLDNSRLFNLVWTNQDKICGVKYNFQKGLYTILTLNIFGEKLRVSEEPCHLGCMIGSACLDELTYFQSTSGAVYQYNPATFTLCPTPGLDGRNVAFPTPCPQMAARNLDGKVFVFGWNERGRLYINSQQLFGNCSSFLLHDDHLLVTTVSHKLFVLPLKTNAIMTALQSPEGALVVAGERSIERGAKLVTAVPGDCEVVLQMPRGNIEVIYPRPLMVHLLQQLLDSRLYHRCVGIMRKHRIDMNLIYDHDPRSFLDSCLEFVQSVESPTWIDVFIAALKNEDTTQTLYSINYKDVKRTAMIDASQDSKVDTVCTAVREAMIKTDEKKYLLPILTSYVKMDASQMDEALRKLQKMRHNSGSEVSCEEGLRHLLYIADADALCDVALGTYDFDLVMMVFEKSQKDPKEFLPFLNKLRRMETNYMKYSINVHLKRYKEAFRCLRDTGASHVEECLALIKREKLYSEGLECLSGNSAAYGSIAHAYADYNFGRGQFHEAALLFERAEAYDLALDAYMQLCNWRKVIIMAKKLKYSKEQMLDLYYSLIDRLKERKMFKEAAVMYVTHLSAEEEAVSCLAMAHLWDDAVSLSLEHERSDLVDTLVLPELMSQAHNVESDISAISSSISKSCSRLSTVRELKEKEYMDALEHVDDAHLDSEMYCDSSTVTGHSTRSASSGTSGRTYRSAKNRKKLDRKKYSIKEGSTYEDLGLISEIHGLFVRADELAKPVSDVLSTLFSFGKDEKAVRLQESLHNLYRLMESKQEMIWPSEAPDSDEVLSGPHLSTTELLKSRLHAGRGDAGGVAQRLMLRMKELEPHLRYPPKVTRPSNWAFGFLQRSKKSVSKSKS